MQEDLLNINYFLIITILTYPKFVLNKSDKTQFLKLKWYPKSVKESEIITLPLC